MMDVKRNAIFAILFIYHFVKASGQPFLFSSALCEQVMDSSFHKLYQHFESAIKLKKIKVYPYGFNELKFSDSCACLCGTETVEGKEGIVYKNYTLRESEIIFNAMMNKGERTNETMSDLIRWNISVKAGKEIKHFAIINADVFSGLADSADLQFFSQTLNYIKLFDKKLYTKYTPLNLNSLKDYAYFIPFSLNMRMRNLAMHQTIPVYSRCLPWFDKETEKYLLGIDSLQATWERSLSERSNCADTSNSISGFGLTESEPGKNTCLMPVIGYHTCSGKHEPIYGGSIQWKTFSSELTSEERFVLNYILTQKRKLHLH